MCPQRCFTLPLLAALLLVLAPALGAQIPAAPTLPEEIKPAYEVLKADYPKFERRRAAKPPVDSVWIFRSPRMSEGNLEVGFEGKEVVYMIIRRGAGGGGWKPAEIKAIHLKYHRDLLQEEYDARADTFSRYNHALSTAVNGAVISRKDFDTKAILSGL